MSDETINITIQEDPLPLVIDTGTPELTITDNQGAVTVVDAGSVNPVIAEDNLKLIINNGGYAGSVSVLLDDLVGKLTRNQMIPELALDLERLESLWTRVGSELLLTYPEGLSIQEAGREYTDNSITDAVADITLTTDGKIDAAYSIINQNASAITQTVAQLEGDLTDRFVVNESLISQTAESINSVVTRLDTVDGPGGAVELLQSSILQTNSSLNAEVTARKALGDTVTEATTSISLLSDSLTLASESISTINDRMSSAELILGTDGINITVLEEALADHEYSIGTFQNVLTNQWGVTIEEDASGNKYAAGFGLLLHPMWLLDTPYVVDDTVYYADVVYQCILAHTADATNSPGSTNAAIYWTELPEGTKSAFTVQADSFNILTSSGLTPVFSVTEGHAVLNGDLAVFALESTNYGTAGEPWFKLDSSTGLAEFNNMVAVFGSGSSGYSNISDAPQNVADGATNDADLRYSEDVTKIDGGKIYTPSLSAIQAKLGNAVIDTAGSLYSEGKNFYGSTTPGFFLGYDSGQYALNIGDANKYLKYRNGLLEVGGEIITTENLEDNAATVSICSFNSTLRSYPTGTEANDVIIQDAWIDATGAEIQILWGGHFTITLLSGSSVTITLTLYAREGETGTPIALTSYEKTLSSMVNSWLPTFVIDDQPSAGTWVYYVNMYYTVSDGGAGMNVRNTAVSLLETKK